MRLAVVSAICCSMIALAVADPARAAIKMRTDISAQGLGPALKQLARDRGFQVVFRSEIVGNIQTRGAHGDLTTSEALTELLEGTNLVYSYLDDSTVAILARAELQSGAATSPDGPLPNGDGNNSARSEQQKSPSFRLAQVDQGSPGAVAPVASNSGEPARLEQVVVTAQKREERLQDVPVPVSIIDTEKLVTSNAVLLRDYYPSVPGLIVTPNYVSRQNISMRGIGSGPLDNPTVALTLDDIPLGSTSISGTSIPDLDPGDLARIEVLRGPQGTLYGASSMGGLLKFVTADPSPQGFSGRLQGGVAGVENGSDPGYDFRGSANMPVSQTFAIRASAYHRQDPGYIDNTLLGTKGVNERRSSGGLATALWKPSENFSLRLTALYQYDDWDALDEVVPSLGDLKQDYIPNAGPGTRQTQLYGAVIKAKLGGVDFTSVTGYFNGRNTLSLDSSFALGYFTNRHFGVASNVYLEPDDRYDHISQEVRFSSSIGDKFDWLAGAFFSHEKTNHLNIVDAEDPTTGKGVGRYLDHYSEGDSSFQEYAGFADLTYHATGRLDIQLGGRVSRERVVTPTQVDTGFFASDLLGGDPSVAPGRESRETPFTYLVTPSFKVSPDLMVYARLASGYRPGGPNGNIAPGIPLQFNADKTKNYELGLKSNFLDHRIFVDVSLYYIDWSNLQFGAVANINGAPYNYTANGGKAKSNGVELSASVKPWRGMTLSGYLSYDKADLTEDLPLSSTALGLSGDRIPFSSKLSGNLSFDQEFPFAPTEFSGFVGGSVGYIGDRLGPFTNKPGPGQPDTPRQDFPAYARLDLRAGVRSDSWTINAYVNNATDRRGVLDGGTGYFKPDARIYITPRMVGLNVIRSF